MQPPPQNPYGPPGGGPQNPYGPPGYPQGYPPGNPYGQQQQPPRPVDPVRAERATRFALGGIVLAVISAFVFPVVNLLLWLELLGHDAHGGLFLFSLGLGFVSSIAAVALAVTALAFAQPGQTSPRVVAIISLLLSVVGVVTAVAATLFGALMATGGGAHGRPLRVRGRGRRAATTEDDGAWADAGITPDTMGIDPETRAALAGEWENDARMEHASVAAFGKLALDLMALGAPPELLTRVHRAAVEEVEHARSCFALASAYAGRALGAAAFPEAASAGPRGESWEARLERVAVECAVDGCVGEGAAAAVARRGAEMASDPVVAAVLARIAREEQGHAELSRAVMAWCVARGGERVERAVVGALDAMREVGSARGVESGLAAYGRVDAAQWAVERARLRSELLGEFERGNRAAA